MALVKIPASILAVVVAYGHSETLAACIRSLRNQDAICQVVVVDNSRDDRIAELCLAAAAIYLDPGANVGYARGARIGVGAGGPGFTHVLIANPDLVLLNLAPLLDSLEGGTAIIVTGCLIDGDGKLQANCRRTATPRSELSRACF